MIGWLLLAAVLGSGGTWVACRFLVLPLLRGRGVIDRPNARSSHTSPVVRGGGIAVIMGFVFASVVAIGLDGFFLHGTNAWDNLNFNAPGTTVVLMALAFGVIGFVDDLDSLSASTRLLAQVAGGMVFAAGVMIVLDVGLWAGAVIVVSVVFVVNAVNFMDGLNTLISGWAVVAGLWLGFMAVLTDTHTLAIAGVALGAAASGFIPFNTNPAQAFLGDVGSYALGGAAVALAWLAWVEGAPVVAVLAPIVVPGYDVVRTLIVRMLAGENIFQAHKDHLYQRMHQAGAAHESVATGHGLATLLCCLVTIPAVFSERWAWEFLAVAVWLLVLLAYTFGPDMVRARVRRAGGHSEAEPA
ncbi:hypothetical protein [Brevibacterium litoralis]|uniref:hypothetical protein n=1 Tax=Brevibacterium litoralis TaxID=3138935 RepID=UPI0032EC3223